MLYKTIVLQLLEQCPERYDQLRRQRKMLPTLEYYARELMTLHDAWKDVLVKDTPESDTAQITTAALEMAVKDLEDRLLSGSVPDESETLSLDQAMAFIRKHTSRD